MTFAGSTIPPENAANEWNIITHMEDKGSEMCNINTTSRENITGTFFLIKKPIENFFPHNLPPSQRESDVNVTLAYMEGDKKSLRSHSAVTPQERINGSLMISTVVINRFTFGIYNTDPWLPLFYSCPKPC